MTQPNIVLILADDMREELLQFAPFVGGILRAMGTRYTNTRCSIPVCSPVRAGLLTGQYARGSANQVYTNDRSNVADPTTHSLPVWMKTAGYNTCMIGKTVIPGLLAPEPGWDSWTVMSSGVQQAYGYTMTDGSTPSAHQLTHLTTAATTFVAAATTPWFLYFASTNPHINTSTFTNNPLPATQTTISAFDKTLDLLSDADAANKPSWISATAQFTPAQQGVIQNAARQQAREVWDLDASVRSIYDAVTTKGQQANTFYFFLSDSGVFWGEQRLGDVFAGSKGHVYDCVAKVPCIIKGPGVPAGHTVTAPAIVQDITRTICKVAGAVPTVPQHGVDLLAPMDPNRATLFERQLDTSFPDCDGIVTPTRRMLVHRNSANYGALADPFVDTYEMYYTDTDPHEYDNRGPVDPTQRAQMQVLLTDMLASIPTATAVTNRGTGTLFDSGTSNVTSVTLNKPAGLNTGDLLVATVATRDNRDITWPAGWTPIAEADGDSATAGNKPTVAAAWRILQSGDPATWTATMASGTAAASVTAYRDHDPANPIQGYTANVTANPTVLGNTITATTLYANRNKSFLHIVMAGVGTSLAFPAGTTQAFDSGSAASGAVSAIGCYISIDSSGDTGAITSAVTGGASTNGWAALAIVVQRAV